MGGYECAIFGASVAAIAVAASRWKTVAPALREVLRERLDWLRAYLKKHYATQNLHNRVWLLWASANMDGLLTAEHKKQLFEQIFAKQLASGGWSLGSLGDFTHGEIKTPATMPYWLCDRVKFSCTSFSLPASPKEDPCVAKGSDLAQGESGRFGCLACYVG